MLFVNIFFLWRPIHGEESCKESSEENHEENDSEEKQLRLQKRHNEKDHSEEIGQKVTNFRHREFASVALKKFKSRENGRSTSHGWAFHFFVFTSG
jgi:hypothetical protein